MFFFNSFLNLRIAEAIVHEAFYFNQIRECKEEESHNSFSYTIFAI